MKIQIRHSVFETNSSSTHAVAILSDEEYQKYRQGKVRISRYGKFITEEEYNTLIEKAKNRKIENMKKAWDNPTDWDYDYLHKHYKTLESAIENLDEDDCWNDDLYEYDEDNMEVIHESKEINGVKVHALSVYGYED